MRYLFLIYGDPRQPDMPELLARYTAFTSETVERGTLRVSHQLQRADTATTVRVRDGRLLVSDGPYAETKEQIGGFYLLECRDLDEALDWAAKIPTAEDGVIEVRPVVERSE
jgi:hypothetical protein